MAPLGKVQLIAPRGAKRAVNLIFQYSDLDGVPDLSVQLVLTHGPNGTWPPATYIVFPALDTDDSMSELK